MINNPDEILTLNWYKNDEEVIAHAKEIEEYFKTQFIIAMTDLLVDQRRDYAYSATQSIVKGGVKGLVIANNSNYIVLIGKEYKDNKDKNHILLTCVYTGLIDGGGSKEVELTLNRSSIKYSEAKSLYDLIDTVQEVSYRA